MTYLEESKLNFLRSGSNSNCPARVVLFARGKKVLVEAPVFTSKPNDTIRLSVADPVRVRIQALVLTCRDEHGAPCPTPPAGSKSRNYVAEDAEDDEEYADWLYGESMAGLQFDMPLVKDIHDEAFAKEIEGQILNSHQDPDFRDVDCEVLPRTLGQVNVYYTSVGAGLAKTCSDKQVIVMPVGTRADVLSHELGHALGLDHPVRPDITNVMQPGAGLDRCNLSLEQILKIQAALPSGSDTSKACPPGSPDCQLAMLRSDDAPCPQATAATVLDWIRCSHCPVDRRPFELASDPDALMEIVPDIRKFLVGTLRIEERLKVEMLADAAAADAATLGLKVNEGTGDAYRKLLLERYQIRAAAALSALGRDPLPPHRTAPRDETFKVTALQTAIDSLAWALGLTAPEKEDPPAWGPISEPTVALIACQHLNILLNTQARRTGQDPKPVPCAAESSQLPAAK